MKKQFPKILVVIGFLFLYNNVYAQNSFCYPLATNLVSQETNQPSLEALANSQGNTGSFVSLLANNNLCSSNENMSLYYFEDNAGLRFDNSNNYIDCSYTLEMTFKLETFPTLFDPAWIRILGFSNDDTGVFFYKVPFFGDIVLEFWENNTQLLQCPLGFFNEQDWYKLILVRDCEGQVQVYVNCELMCTYDDATTNLFLPKNTTGNQIIFFQDDPTTLAAESSSGWVKNIKISDFAQTSDEVISACDCPCEELVGCEIVLNALSTTCNPDDVMISSDTLTHDCSCACDTILMTEVTLLPSDSIFIENTTCDEDAVGVDIQNLQNVFGCDSIVIKNTILEESPYLEDSIILADSGISNGSISISIGGGLPPYSYLWTNDNDTPTISGLTGGSYMVTVTDQNGCTLVLDFEVEIVNALLDPSILEYRIFPNPVHSSDFLFIQFHNTKTRHLQIELFDVSGRIHFHKELFATRNTFQFVLEMSFERGIYFLQIKDNEGRSDVKKIVLLN